MDMDIEIRPLTVTDVFTVARMLSKVTKGAKAEIATALTAEEKPDPTELGMVLFQSVFIEAEEDLKAWLADLIGKTKQVTRDDETITVPDVAAFEIMPATTIIDIIEAFIRQEGAMDFFERVSQLVSKVGSTA